MVLSISSEFKREVRKGSVKLEAVARINLPQRTYLDVVDYVAAENGQLDFTITKRVTEQFLEQFDQGVDYSGITPDATALSIANRINATATLSDLTATPVDNSVQVVAANPVTRIQIRHRGDTPDKNLAIRVIAASDLSITLIVDDNGDTGSGHLDITVDRDGDRTSSVTLSEGTEYDADVSEETTASRIVIAIHGEAGLSALRAKQIGGGNRIQITGGGAVTSFTVAHTGSPAPANDGAITSNIPDAPQQVFFQTGDTPLSILASEQGAHMGLSEIQSIGYGLDAMTREYTTDEVELTFLDGNDSFEAGIRKIASEYPLFGRTVDLYLGTEGINVLGNWFRLPSMIITEVLPRPGAVVVRLEDFSALWRDQQVVGAWVQEHPLNALVDVMTTRTRQIDQGTHVDATTFDPSDASHADIGHFVVTRLSEPPDDNANDPPIDEAVDEAVSAGDLVKELLFVVGGMVRPDATGAFRYRHWDADRAADRTWAAGPLDGHDVDEVDQISGYGEIINDAKIEFLDAKASVELENAGSLDQLGRKFEFESESPWLNAIGRLSLIGTRNTGGGVDDFELDAASFLLQAPRGYTGFAGHAWELVGNTLTKPAHAELAAVSGTNRAFIKIEPIRTRGRFTTSSTPDESVNRVDPEYIAINDLELLSQITKTVTYDEASGVTKTKEVAISVRWHIDTAYNDPDLGFVNGRAGLGTVSPERWGEPVLGDFATGNPRLVDVTIPIYILQRILDRFKYGAPVVRCRTRFTHVDLEVGDFVSLSGDDIYLGFLKSGADSNVIFELTKKTLLPFDDFPSIEWEMTFVRDDSQPVEVATATFVPQSVTVLPPTLQEPYFDQTGTPYIADDGGGIYYPDT